MSLRTKSFLTALLLSGISITLLGCADLATGKAALKSGDYPTAARHYGELAEFGLPEAKYAYARMLLKGQGGPVDEAKARQLLEDAADQGYTRTYVPLAKMLAKGQGGPAEPYRARELLNKAVAEGDTKASLQLAKLYQQGVGGPKDLDSARAIYLEAYEAGNASMAYNLGRIAEEQGKLDDAIVYYKEAVKAGKFNAARQLGTIYEREIQPPQLINGLAWYYVARENNVKNMDKRIEKLERKLGPNNQSHARKIAKGLK